MIVFLQLTTAGIDSGPFDLYSNLDGYSEPFEENVSRDLLIAGYSTTVPDNAITVRITSKEDCISSVDITLRNVECNLEGYTGEITTTTTTTTTIPVYQFTVYLGSSYCNSGVCYLDGTPTDQIVYLPPGAEPTIGGYLYTDPALTVPFVTSQIISTYNMLLTTDPTGELFLVCNEGSTCLE